MTEYITLLLCSGKDVEELAALLEEIFAGKLERVTNFFISIFNYISSHEKEFANPATLKTDNKTNDNNNVF